MSPRDMLGDLDHRAATSASLLVSPDDGEWTMGEYGVAEIVVYRENGEMAQVPWVRITMMDGRRINFAARHAIIVFGP